MFKKISIAALATVSMCAFAGTQHQDQGYGQTWKTQGWHNTMDIDAADMSMSDQKKAVEWRASQCLSGSDQFDLNQTLNRAPMNVEAALLSGLCKSHRQAVMINDQMLAWRYPSQTTVSTTAVGDGYATTTTTTTYDSPANWSAMDWSGQENSFRPMRMIMTKESKPKELSYGEAIEVLTSDLPSTSTGILSDWWYHKASETQKDVIVRLLNDDASMADQTYYPSVYMHRSYDWAK